MIELMFVGLVIVILVAIYWKSSSSPDRRYHSEKMRHETKLKLKQKQEMMKFQAQEEERRRRLRGFRGWRSR
ncbi:MAG: hypothetical protein ACXAAO_06465 [Candidatus Thorarchaeota archaeon]